MIKYYMYQITNLVNGKIYVGVHKTKSLDDGYMGSGKIIRSAIQKHGISNFSKDILEYFDSSEAMYAREKEIVTEEFLLREDTYNLQRGGHGGFDYINKKGINNINNQSKGKTHSIETRAKMSAALSGVNNPWYNRKHTEETKNKISNSMRGEDNHRYGVKISSRTRELLSNKSSGSKNSQFGSMWITNDEINKKIKRTDSIPDGFRKGRL